MTKIDMAQPEQQRRGPWMKRVLIPFWFFQLLFMCALVGLNIWASTGVYSALSSYVDDFLTHALNPLELNLQ